MERNQRSDPRILEANIGKYGLNSSAGCFDVLLSSKGGFFKSLFHPNLDLLLKIKYVPNE